MIEKKINDVIDNLNLPYKIKLFVGEKKELNLLNNWTDHLVLLIRPIIIEPTYITGERKYIYNDFKLFFGKVSKLQDNSESELMKEALHNYEQFIKTFRKLEYIKVTRELITEIFNDLDMNLAGYSISLNFEEQIISSQCVK